MIKIRSLFKQYDHQPLFKGLNLDIEKGSVVSLIGPSGSGKSTLLRCINRLETFQGGYISVGGQTHYGTQEKKHSLAQNERETTNIRRKIGMVFQQFNLFPHMTVISNITVSPIHVLGAERSAAESHAISLLRKVRLEDKALCYPDQLSGGEQQRVAISRTLAMRPEAILFDEPTSSLDPEMTREVLRVIKDLVLEGMTIILATHEMSFAKNVSTNVVFLEKGIILEYGDAKDIFNKPKNDRTKIFLGECPW